MHTATLFMRDGRRVEGLFYSSRWSGDPHFAIAETVPTSALQAVADIRPGAGFVSGLLLGPGVGLAGGFVTGGLIGASLGDADDPKYDVDVDGCIAICFTSPGAEGAFAGGMLGLLGGALVGPIVGIVRGNGTLYGELPAEPADRVFTVTVIPTPDGTVWGLAGTF